MRRGWNDENSTEANEGNKEQKKEDGMSRRVVITGIGPLTSLSTPREQKNISKRSRNRWEETKQLQNLFACI